MGTAGQKLGGCPPAKCSLGRKAGHLSSIASGPTLPLPQSKPPPALWQVRVFPAALAGWTPSCLSPATTAKEGRASRATSRLPEDQPVQGKEDKGKFLLESSVQRDQKAPPQEPEKPDPPLGKEAEHPLPGESPGRLPNTFDP